MAAIMLSWYWFSFAYSERLPPFFHDLLCDASQEILDCQHHHHLTQPPKNHALCLLPLFLGVTQLGSQNSGSPFGLSIAIHNFLFAEGRLCFSLMDITGAAFAFFFFFFFSDPVSLSVSEPFSAGAELLGCLNLWSFPFLHVPFFQNEQTPSFLGRSSAGELLRLGPSSNFFFHSAA